MELESPGKEIEALHVAVGVSVVWVVTKDYKVNGSSSHADWLFRVATETSVCVLLYACVCVCVQVWFRRGVNSHNPCGSGWISIGGEMMVVDVGLNEQVKRSFQPGHNVLVFPFLLFNANSVCITNV